LYEAPRKDGEDGMQREEAIPNHITRSWMVLIYRVICMDSLLT
jgi:hypothetical protein